MAQHLEAPARIGESTLALVVMRRADGGVRQLRLTWEHLVLAVATIAAAAAWAVFGFDRLSSPRAGVREEPKPKSQSVSWNEVAYARIDEAKIIHRGSDAEVEFRILTLPRGKDTTARLWGIAEWKGADGSVRRVASASGVALDASGSVLDARGGDLLSLGMPLGTRLRFDSPGAGWAIVAIRVGLSTHEGKGAFDVARIVPGSPSP